MVEGQLVRLRAECAPAGAEDTLYRVEQVSPPVAYKLDPSAPGPDSITFERMRTLLGEESNVAVAEHVLRWLKARSLNPNAAQIVHGTSDYDGNVVELYVQDLRELVWSVLGLVEVQDPRRRRKVGIELPEDLLAREAKSFQEDEEL